MDVLTQLSQEHDALRTHLERIESAAAARNVEELSACLHAASKALNDELDAHIATEEAEAFSAIAATLGDGLLTPFYDEHVEIRALRDEIYVRLARGQAPFDLCLRLCELILAHQQREDVMLFPSAREAMVR